MKKTKKLLVSALLSSVIFSGTANACSTFIVPVHSSNSAASPVSNVIGVRTMDFEEGLSNPLVYGLANDSNVSTVDTSNTTDGKGGAIAHPAKWVNKYQFIGKGTTEGRMIEGINTAGVYVGGLYLPNITDYPRYNSSVAKPALGVFDLVNYVLGTSDSLQSAVDNLSKVQVVVSTLRIAEAGKYVNEVFPLHFFIADKSGHTAVIEFIGGVMRVNSHSAGLRNLTSDSQVMTNSPDIQFQIAHYNELLEKNKFSSQNKPVLVDGMYMNGSGYLGLPGDSTPPSRFAHINTILSASPVAYNDNQADFVANMTRNTSALVPIGFNAAPTLWATKYNLAKGSYQVTNYVEVAASGHYLVTPETSSYYQHLYNVNNITTEMKVTFSHGVLKASKQSIAEDVAASKGHGKTASDARYDAQFGVSANAEQARGTYVAM